MQTAREAHFKRVAVAFGTLSMVVFGFACVSLSKGPSQHAQSLYVAPAAVQQSARVAPAVPSFAARSGRVMAMGSNVHPQVETEAMTGLPMHMAAPQQVPTAFNTNVATGGAFIGMFGVISGLVFLLRTGKKAPAFDPMSSVAIATTSGTPELKGPNAPRVVETKQEEFVTIEYQRKKAKELFEYYETEELLQQSKDAQVFGWTPANEISNGRWVMFGWLVGMLTEYATGASFVEQIKITLNNLAILDID